MREAVKGNKQHKMYLNVWKYSYQRLQSKGNKQHKMYLNYL